MSPEYTFFYLIAFVALWVLSVAGGIAVLVSWSYVDPEYDEEGVLTRSSLFLVRARALLTAGCMVFWICTLLGHALTDSNGTTLFGFWQNHALLLVTLFFLADIFLIAAVVFAWQARGSGKWILWIAPSVIATASIVGSCVLFLAAVVPWSTSF
jgi:hypothetical protein